MSLNESVAICLTIVTGALFCICLVLALKSSRPIEKNLIRIENRPSKFALIFGFILALYGIYIVLNGLPGNPNSRRLMGAPFSLWGILTIWGQVPNFLKSRDLFWNEDFVEGPNRSFSFKPRIASIKINWADVVGVDVTRFTNRHFLESNNGDRIYYNMNYGDDDRLAEKIRESLGNNFKM